MGHRTLFGTRLAAHLVLEKADGTLDLVPSNELAKLLRPARGRLKWVTLSAWPLGGGHGGGDVALLGVEPHRAPAPVAGIETSKLWRARWFNRSIARARHALSGG